MSKSVLARHRWALGTLWWLFLSVGGMGVATAGEGGATDAATCKTIHAFTGADGTQPRTALVLGSDGKLHGITYYGGEQDGGVAFRALPNGHLVVLHNFPGDGVEYLPNAQMQARNGDYYGTASLGGAFGEGSVYRMSPRGKVTTLHSFNHRADSGGPSEGALIEADDGRLFGTTYGYYPFEFDAGVIYAIGLDGGLTVLHRFERGGAGGTNPSGGLIQASDGHFYGTTGGGGSEGRGTVYRWQANGTFTVLHSFQAAEGAQPQGPLVEGPGGALFGVTQQVEDDPLNRGSVFRLDPADGTLVVLHRFVGLDGSFPIGPLHLGRDGALYGVTFTGGRDDEGVVYRITTDGVFELLHEFGPRSTHCAHVGYPLAGLVETADGEFYGTSAGWGWGTIYRIRVR